MYNKRVFEDDVLNRPTTSK